MGTIVSAMITNCSKARHLVLWIFPQQNLVGEVRELVLNGRQEHDEAGDGVVQ